MKRKWKVGVIGTGSISHEHIRAYLKNENVELYALCDINPARVHSMAEQYGVPQERAFTDMADLLALPEIDAVSVCTWNSAHAPCTIAALEAGKHVLCEKPMALNAQEALSMQQAAEKAGKILQIGFVRRFGNDCATIRDFVNAGYFGDFYYAKATYLRRNGCPGGWFGEKARSGGGPLIDLGVHVIDLVRYLMGNPQPVSVYGATFQKLLNRPQIKKQGGYSASDRSGDDVFDVEDLASAMIRFDNGTVLHVEAAFSLNIKEDSGEIELFGSKAGAKLDPQVHLYSDVNGYLVNVDFDQDTALSFDGLFANEISHFIDCVRGRAECIAPASDGVTLMRILDAIYESGRTGHEVLLHS